MNPHFGKGSAASTFTFCTEIQLVKMSAWFFNISEYGSYCIMLTTPLHKEPLQRPDTTDKR